MRIRKLELHGFKSFPDRTALHFGAGISCVVGPNGCGKSNIADAVKWCIGEQSAKTLRGDEMMDVVFAGSADRAPVGFAEVTLGFSSEGGEPFPGEYARFTDIEVTRRLHRDGSSEYLINGARCRRKDIVDLFLDTGVGNNLYSFIEQGAIGKIVHATPEARRSLIDEAAGISRYKARREEALSHLEATASQLDRATDVADEMAKRLKSLERQVLKAAQFRRLRALVRQREIVLALARYADLAAERRQLRERQRGARAELETLEREHARRDADLATRSAAVESAAVEWAAARDALAELDARVRELEGARGFLERRAEELATASEAAREDRASADAEREAATAEGAAAAARGTELEAESTAAAGAAAAAAGALAEASGARDVARATAEGCEAEVAAARDRLAVAGARAEDLRRSLDQLPGRVAALMEAQAAAEEALRAARLRAGTTARELTARLDESERARAAEDAAASAQATSEAVFRARAAERAEAERAVDASRRAVDAVRARLEAARIRVEREREAEAREAERAIGERVARARTGSQVREAEERRRSRERVDASERRASAWVEAVDAAEQAGIAARARAREAADAAFDAAGRAALAAAEAQADAVVAAAEQEERDALEARLAAFELRRGAAERRSDAHTEALAAVDTRIASETRAVGGLEGRLAGIAAQEAARRARDGGALAVASALPAASRLADLLDLGDEEASSWGPALARGLLLPVVTDVRDVLRAADVARTAGAASVVWVARPEETGEIGGREPGPAAAHRLLAAAAGVDDLPAALAHHRATGGAAVVRATGERVDADGIVTVGGASDGAMEVLRLQRDRAETAARLAAAQESLDAARRERARCATAQAEAREALVGVSAELRELERAGREAVRERVEGVRQATRARLDTDRAALADRAIRARRERDAEVASDREAAAARVAALRAELREVVARLREEEDRRLATWLAGEVQALDGERAAAVGEAELRRAARRALAETELEALAAEVEVAGAAAEVAVAALAASREDEAAVASTRDACAARLERTRADRSERDLASVRAESARHAIETECEALEARIGELVARLEETTAAAEDLEVQEAAARETMASASERADGAERRLGRAREVLGAVEAREREAREADAEARLGAATLAERLRANGVALAAALRRAAEADSRLGRASERVVALLGDIETVATEREITVSSLATASAEREGAAVRNGAARDAQAAARDAHRAAEAALRKTAEGREAAIGRAQGLEARVHEVQLEVDALRSRIDERYQISLPGLLDRLDAQRRFLLESDPLVRSPLEIGDRRIDAVPDLDLTPGLLDDEDGLRGMLEDLEAHRRELQAIGEVNLAALEEYREVEGRFAELAAQRGDLEESVATIRAAIAKMNRMCRERFRDAFDRVNERFEVLYPRLVGGGTARLALTNEEDLLETGVEIYVQPPGKRLQNLSLLSGGEKAMTAIALLLSLFHVKPSPFCLLDEVDAPLDEGNGARFNDVLREMSGLCQFIVITHNRKSMEAADTLYGITMPTPGVSRLVSVRVADVAVNRLA